MKKLNHTLLAIMALAAIIAFGASPAQAKGPKVEVAKVSTEFGDIYLYLYAQTPIHKRNFLELARKGFYNGTTFHRVIPDFMIQGGDPNSKDADPLNDGSGGPPYTGGPDQQKMSENGYDSYTIPAEFRPNLYHKPGALAAARTGDNINPQKRSSGSQFYIAVGKVETAARLKDMERRMGTTFTPEQIKTYTTEGGIPFLDRNYTVFGETLRGMDVVKKVIEVPRNNADRPLNDVKMKVTVKKYSLKKLKKEFNWQPDEQELAALKAEQSAKGKKKKN